MIKKLLMISTATLLALGNIAYAANNDHNRAESYRKSYDDRRGDSFANLNNLKKDPLYIKECGSCHMAYQPEFLPRRSWDKIMATLKEHFGTDATLSPEDDKAIYAYLMDNAADRKRVGRHFTKLAGSIGKADVPLRISDTPYFIKAHAALTPKQVSQPEVKSIANCAACHLKAEQGDYRERTIVIPNYGPWED